MDVDKLNPHPKNNYFFDDIEGEAWTAFLESVETSGVIEPVIVDAVTLTIVSGHQRVRACKVLGIKQVLADERGFDSEDEMLKQLIEANIRQRGIGNINPVKFGRCIAELERIYGIKNGNNQHTERVETKFPPKTQSEDSPNGTKQKWGCGKFTTRQNKILLSIPKASGRPTENSSSGVEKLKTKAETGDCRKGERKASGISRQSARWTSSEI